MMDRGLKLDGPVGRGALRCFKSDVADAVLADLRARLASTRWPDQIPGSAWRFGFDYAYLREFCEYWQHSYDWRKWEARLNRHPQFICQIDGLDVHFIEVRSSHAHARPLLLMHGWPGSIIEFEQLIDALCEPQNHGGGGGDAFHVVIPSLPGFGFSGHPQTRGWAVKRFAAVLDTLMYRVLGYEKYVAQGGDIGALTSAQIGRDYPEHLLGVHLNWVPHSVPSEDALSESERETLRWRHDFEARHTAHRHVQSTVPDALALAQSDSPAGLAAWVLHKFRVWSDCGGDLESIFSRDVLISNLMLYWVPNSIASAARFYVELFKEGGVGTGYVSVPTGVSAFPIDTWRAPRKWVEPHYNLIHWTDMPRGGHFAALEQPELFLNDLRLFAKKLS